MGGRAFVGWALLLLGGLIEGISILLLIPMLQLAGPEYRKLGSGVDIPVLSGLFGEHFNFGLAPVLALFVLLMSAQAIFVRFKNIYMAKLITHFIHGVHIDVFGAIGLARWSRVAAMKPSDLQHVLTAEVDRLNGAAFNLLLIIQTVVLLLIYLVVAGMISAPMTIFAVGVGALAFVLVRPIRKLASQHGRRLVERGQAKYGIIAEFLSGLKLAKIFEAERRYAGALSANLDLVGEDHIRWTRTNSISNVVFQMANVIGLAIFVYAALEVFKLPLAQIVVLVLVFMRIAPRFSQLQTQTQDLLVSLSAWKNVMDLQAECAAAAEPTGVAVNPFHGLKDEVRIRDLRFGYSGATVLSEINLTIRAGQITALLGPSGGGKSTLADVLMGLLEPQAGEIRIDDVALSDENVRAWRRRVAYVPQDVFLLNDTIAANLAIADPEATEAMMWAALERANAKAFVEAIPEGLKTIVGDRGARLSGGERQRISLARALLRRPDLLILDEATSALDGENQMLIGKALQELRGSTTILTIAHRAAMVAIADHLVILESGHIVEQGSFKELAESPSGRLKSLTASDGGGDRELAAV